MFKRISTAQTHQMLESSDVNLIDIRDPQRFAAAHMPNAKNINNQNAEQFIEQSDKKIPLIVVCYHGHSSQPAAQYFAANGFEDVYSMDGGFEMWKMNFEVIG